ncbi:hypothetical protein CRENBAI_017990 [Crenichthys baileyi]|uniref:Uncharacterized protein n=1 Tax=Crenichthys baileyi TaxID=28760 RepID=A0AAV9QTK1_9TELE
MDTPCREAEFPSIKPPVRVTCKGVGTRGSSFGISGSLECLYCEKDAAHDLLKLWGRPSCQPRREHPSMGATIAEEAPNITSPAYSDKARWASEPGQEAPLSGSLRKREV